MTPLTFVIAVATVILCIYIGRRLKEHEWRKQCIYKPMYNELSYVLRHKTTPSYVFGNVSTKWEHLDDYSKAVVPEDIKNTFDNYALSVESLRNFINSKVCIAALKEAFQEINLSVFNEERHNEERYNEEKHIVEEQTFTMITPHEWFSIFGGIILACTNKENLYKNLIDYCKERGFDTQLIDNLFNISITEDLYAQFQDLSSAQLAAQLDLSAQLIETFSCKKQKSYCTFIKQIRDRLEKILTLAKDLHTKLHIEINKIW